MKAEFKLVGLGKPRSATLEHLDNDRDTFWGVLDMPEEKISELWNMCKGNWDDVKIAEVECDYLSEDGVPVNAKVKSIRFKN